MMVKARKQSVDPVAFLTIPSYGNQHSIPIFGLCAQTPGQLVAIDFRQTNIH